MNRKKFIGLSTFGVMGMLAAREDKIFNLLQNENDKSPTNEKFWKQIRKIYYPRPSNFINLENGYFSPQPKPTMQFHIENEQYINSITSKFMRTEQEQAIENARKSLANFLQINSEELAITRNTTESLNTIIQGYPWQAGDEVIIGNQDYGSMVEAFDQASRRFGISIKVAQIPIIPKSEDEIINAYLSLKTDKTRLLHLTHLINLTGQIIPVKKIAEAFSAYNIEIAVDAAHSVAHIPVEISTWKVHYVASSLHKWMCNPLGVGFLWVKQSCIEKIWPLMGDVSMKNNNIRKFEHQGTRPIHSIMSIEKSIEIHEKIGAINKENRLRYLQNTWTESSKSNPNINLLVPAQNPNQSCAIATFAVNNKTPNETAKYLWLKKIYSVAINHPIINGVRITPHIFTTKEEITSLVNAINEI